MEKEYDSAKVFECIFDSDVQVILAELEDGPKDIDAISQKTGVSSGEIMSRLSYLTEHGFVSITKEEPFVCTVDEQKIDEVLQNDDNFKTVVDGMTKLDGFLN